MEYKIYELVKNALVVEEEYEGYGNYSKRYPKMLLEFGGYNIPVFIDSDSAFAFLQQKRSELRGKEFTVLPVMNIPYID